MEKTDIKPPIHVQIVSRSPLSPEAAWNGALSPADLARVSYPLIGMSYEGQAPERWEQGRVYRVRVRQFSFLRPRLFEIEFKKIDPIARTFVTEERGGEFEIWRHTLTIVPSETGGSVIHDHIEIVAKRLPPGALGFIRLLYRVRRWRLR